jgi:hypothetical protein
MLLFITTVKALFELALMFTLGRSVLGLLIKEPRAHNVFWQLLDRAAWPARWLTQRCLPSTMSETAITRFTLLWLALAWVAIATFKLRFCLLNGLVVCR